MTPRIAIVVAVATVVGGLSGCGPEKLGVIVVHRSNCEVCHRPLDELAQPHGIEDAHPWVELSCTDCHGGNEWVCSTGETLPGSEGPVCDGEWVYDQDLAHVSPGDGPAYIRNLASAQLDQVDLEYLRFINPGDFRVAETSCGGSDCHQKEAEGVRFSTMGHTSGEVTVPRYRAEQQATPLGVLSGIDIKDPNPPGDDDCAVPELKQMDPPPMNADPSNTDPATMVTVANAQDQYLVKSCFRCHLNDFGENAVPGDFRSSGCTACHMTYDDDGLSRSTDPWVNKQSVPHPITHEITKSPPIQQCTHCHYRGGRIGISYQGYRESAGSQKNPEFPGTLGATIHNHPATWYLTDENVNNDCDETPADLHFEAGMHCVDCHKTVDMHGNGHLYADTQCAVTAECTDCHGTVREHAVIDPERNNLEMIDGDLYLNAKVTGAKLYVPQTKDVVDPTHERFSPLAADSMEVNDEGWSHTDVLECYTCHAGWLPSCYGCHVQVDLTREQRYHTTGKLVSGRTNGAREWVVLNDLILGWNTDGMLAPTMPAERFMMTVFGVGPDGPDGEPVTLIDKKPRVFHLPDGSTIPGFGARAFNPHTTRKRSQFMACDRCHTVGGTPADPENKVLLDITHGFGSERFPQEGCNVFNEDVDTSCGPDDRYTYQLDQVTMPDGSPLVVIGHPDPVEARVLSPEEVEAMRAVVVDPASVPPLYKTKIPADAATNERWPVNNQCEAFDPLDPDVE